MSSARSVEGSSDESALGDSPCGRLEAKGSVTSVSQKSGSKDREAVCYYRQKR